MGVALPRPYGWPKIFLFIFPITFILFSIEWKNNFYANLKLGTRPASQTGRQTDIQLSNFFIISWSSLTHVVNMMYQQLLLILTSALGLDILVSSKPSRIWQCWSCLFDCRGQWTSPISEVMFHRQTWAQWLLFAHFCLITHKAIPSCSTRFSWHDCL